ncbi:CPBP family archaeomyxosortase MrtA [Pyrococcus abyssi]|uniref:CaaX family metalloprotease n=1 Tax=Pyrococcus abyssi (strain GE5 / Orsay) TaxID=272844 RepID=Q9V1R5_PYRAB|nr:CPBP family archaeomyxosortase MrtA [Pyrococcus abyssi]CAB49284.1 Probable protease, caaX family [Pyrococcus abyssi GE5]CCE69739.1 TPA: CaaX family metalloprotease [Pyrococcus abyssi GE5]
MKHEVIALVSLALSFVPPLLSRNFRDWVILLVLAYLLAPSILAKILRVPLSDLGLKKPRGFKLTLILLGFAFVLSFIGLAFPEMKSYYPRFQYSSVVEFIGYELVFGIIMLAHEALFRGFILFPLARRNKILAILAQDIPYTLLHIGKPSIEVPYAFLAGIVFAIIDLKEESIAPSFIVHWLGSAFFDVLCAFT